MMTPSPRDSSAQIAGNVYDKYNSPRRLERWVMSRFYRCFDELVAESGCPDVHEVGCGEGVLSVRLLKQGLHVIASDVDAGIVEQANHRMSAAGFAPCASVRDIYALSPERDARQLVVCCEVLEHLADPERALEAIHRLRPSRLLISVPREPLWRALNVCSGRYVGQAGNTPGHIQHWSTRAFVRLVEQRFTLRALRTPVPWTMALCAPR